MLEDITYVVAVIASPSSTVRMGVFPDLFDNLLIPFRVFEEEQPARDFLHRYMDA